MNVWPDRHFGDLASLTESDGTPVLLTTVNVLEYLDNDVRNGTAHSCVIEAVNGTGKA